MTPTASLYCGDALEVLKTLPEESVQCCVTSPPYWGLRDYHIPGQIGLEELPSEYVRQLAAVFCEVRRVLADDGTLWLNIGDSYSHGGNGPRDAERWPKQSRSNGGVRVRHSKTGGARPKDLLGLPWRVAFALQAAGWYLRSDIIWAKPNPMPESVKDRPTKSHEYVFLLTKSPEYFYDAEAIAEAIAPATEQDRVDTGRFRPERGYPGSPSAGNGRLGNGEVRNSRSVWTLPTQPYPDAHFATFPEELARRCILAGSRPGDTVLDPFGGSGTVAQVATGNGRSSIYIDLNPKYLELAKQRIGPLLCEEVPVGSP